MKLYDQICETLALYPDHVSLEDLQSTLIDVELKTDELKKQLGDLIEKGYVSKQNERYCLSEDGWSRLREMTLSKARDLFNPMMALRYLDLEDSKENLEILSQLVKNWDKVKQLKEVAQKCTRTLPLHSLPLIPDLNYDEPITRRDACELFAGLDEDDQVDNDQLSWCSGDTQHEMTIDLTELPCLIFCDKNSALSSIESRM